MVLSTFSREPNEVMHLKFIDYKLIAIYIKLINFRNITSFGSPRKVLKIIKHKLNIHKVNDNLNHFQLEQIPIPSLTKFV